MDYFEMYKDLLKIGTKALLRWTQTGKESALLLMDECARFRADIRSRGLLSDEMIEIAVAQVATPFSR